jgi:serine/threonine protein kinase/tetratricopeptide (TPR) repeat protein
MRATSELPRPVKAMDQRRESKAKAVFGEAVEIPADERDAFLDNACGTDIPLRHRVEELLNGFVRAGEFLSEPDELDRTGGIDQGETVVLGPTSEGVDDIIGRYKLLRVVGEGGFGIVYEAEQLEPMRRTVAVKVIRAGMDSPQALARFERERQALALMDHPNIASVYDGGTTESGRPYLVMEYVRGVPISEYCDSHNLSTAERLALFQQVCSAVQHAHQKGVIHRDLKPSNVLVTIREARPAPKVIDFGIAKALDHRLSERAFATEHRQLLGTLEYMSPEQAQMNGLDIDTRSDVYSLGVLLYELLTGSTPFDGEELRSVGYGEMQRIMREDEPPRPSAKVSTLGHDAIEIARRRHCDPAALTRTIRGDLDWIVMKSLEKDRTRRYETASHFSADIQRFMSHEPVDASPPSASYRLRKFIRRNPAGVAAAAVVAVVLVAASAVSATFGVNATRAREEMSRQSRLREAVEEFFLDRVYGTLDPDVAGAGDISARAILDHAGSAVNSVHEPELEAAIRHDFGVLYQSLGMYEKARSHLEAALELREELLGANDLDTIETLNHLALVRAELNDPNRGDLEQARRDLERVVEVRRSQLGPDHASIARSLDDLSRVRFAMDDSAGALEAIDASIAMFERLNPPGEETADHGGAIASRAKYLDRAGRYREAAGLYEEAIRIQQRNLGPDHSRVATLKTLLGGTLSRLGRFSEAARQINDALAVRRKLLLPNHPSIAQSLSSIATNFLNSGQPDKAEPFAREAVQIYTESHGAEHAFVADANVLLAKSVRRKSEDPERLTEALALVDQALDIYDRQEHPDELHVLIARRDRAAILLDLGRIDEADVEAQIVLARVEEGDLPPMLEERTLELLIDVSEVKGDEMQIAEWRRRLDALQDSQSASPPQ